MQILNETKEESDKRSAYGSQATPYPVGIRIVVPALGSIANQRCNDENIEEDAQKLLHKYDWIHSVLL